jgi:hypothetical protein
MNIPVGYLWHPAAVAAVDVALEVVQVVVVDRMAVQVEQIVVI